MTHVGIIGAYGSAGAAVAEELVDDPDVRLTIIDDGDPGGGLCILRGCMPSKELLSAGAHRYQARVDHRLDGTPAVDPVATQRRKEAHTKGWAAHRREGVEDLTDREDVTFIHDTARFVDDRTVAVGDQTMSFDYVVIGTGSTVSVPDIPGLESVDYHTSADALDMTEFPESAVVLGLGYIGLEMVPYLAEVGGVDVTAVEGLPQPLPEAPDRFGETVVDLYERDFGVDVVTDTFAVEVESTDDGVVLRTDHDGAYETITADALFAFTGREPAIHGLGLDNTVIEPGPEWVTETLQTRDDPRVFVAGDATGDNLLLHVAKEEAQQVAQNIRAHAAGEQPGAFSTTPHHVIFSALGVYPYVRLGETPASAAAAGFDPITVTRAAAADGIFKSKDISEGHATLVVDRTDGTVLGYLGVHHHADAMAKTLQIIVELGLDVRELPDRAYHPTTPELLDGLFRAAATKVEEQASKANYSYPED